MAHRGASGYYPPASLPAYLDAYYSGVDFLELDLQVTKDNVLLLSHDERLEKTTNVLDYRDQFKHKISGHHKDGTPKFEIHDFTLDELRILKLRQDKDERPQDFNDLYQLVTLEDLIQTVL